MKRLAQLVLLSLVMFSGHAGAVVYLYTCDEADVAISVADDGRVIPTCGYADETGWHTSIDVVDLASLQGGEQRLSLEDYETLAKFVVYLFVLAIVAKFLMRAMESRAGRYD